MASDTYDLSRIEEENIEFGDGGDGDGGSVRQKFRGTITDYGFRHSLDSGRANSGLSNVKDELYNNWDTNKFATSPKSETTSVTDFIPKKKKVGFVDQGIPGDYETDENIVMEKKNLFETIYDRNIRNGEGMFNSSRSKSEDTTRLNFSKGSGFSYLSLGKLFKKSGSSSKVKAGGIGVGVGTGIGIGIGIGIKSPKLQKASKIDEKKEKVNETSSPIIQSGVSKKTDTGNNNSGSKSPSVNQEKSSIAEYSILGSDIGTENSYIGESITQLSLNIDLEDDDISYGKDILEQMNSRELQDSNISNYGAELSTKTINRMSSLIKENLVQQTIEYNEDLVGGVNADTHSYNMQNDDLMLDNYSIFHNLTNVSLEHSHNHNAELYLENEKERDMEKIVDQAILKENEQQEKREQLWIEKTEINEKSNNVEIRKADVDDIDTGNSVVKKNRGDQENFDYDIDIGIGIDTDSGGVEPNQYVDSDIIGYIFQDVKIQDSAEIQVEEEIEIGKEKEKEKEKGSKVLNINHDTENTASFQNESSNIAFTNSKNEDETKELQGSTQELYIQHHIYTLMFDGVARDKNENEKCDQVERGSSDKELDSTLERKELPEKQYEDMQDKEKSEEAIYQSYVGSIKDMYKKKRSKRGMKSIKWKSRRLSTKSRTSNGFKRSNSLVDRIDKGESLLADAYSRKLDGIKSLEQKILNIIPSEVIRKVVIDQINRFEKLDDEELEAIQRKTSCSYNSSDDEIDNMLNGERGGEGEGEEYEMIERLEQKIKRVKNKMQLEVKIKDAASNLVKLYTRNANTKKINESIYQQEVAEKNLQTLRVKELEPLEEQIKKWKKRQSSHSQHIGQVAVEKVLRFYKEWTNTENDSTTTDLCNNLSLVVQENTSDIIKSLEEYKFGEMVKENFEMKAKIDELNEQCELYKRKIINMEDQIAGTFRTIQQENEGMNEWVELTGKSLYIIKNLFENTHLGLYRSIIDEKMYKRFITSLGSICNQIIPHQDNFENHEKNDMEKEFNVEAQQNKLALLLDDYQNILNIQENGEGGDEEEESYVHNSFLLTSSHTNGSNIRGKIKTPFENRNNNIGFGSSKKVLPISKLLEISLLLSTFKNNEPANLGDENNTESGKLLKGKHENQAKELQDKIGALETNTSASGHENNESQQLIKTLKAENSKLLKSILVNKRIIENQLLNINKKLALQSQLPSELDIEKYCTLTVTVTVNEDKTKIFNENTQTSDNENYSRMINVFDNIKTAVDRNTTMYKNAITGLVQDIKQLEDKNKEMQKEMENLVNDTKKLSTQLVENQTHQAAIEMSLNLVQNELKLSKQDLLMIIDSKEAMSKDHDLKETRLINKIRYLESQLLNLNLNSNPNSNNDTTNLNHSSKRYSSFVPSMGTFGIFNSIKKSSSNMNLSKSSDQLNLHVLQKQQQQQQQQTEPFDLLSSSSSSYYYYYNNQNQNQNQNYHSFSDNNLYPNTFTGFDIKKNTPKPRGFSLELQNTHKSILNQLLGPERIPPLSSLPPQQQLNTNTNNNNDNSGGGDGDGQNDSKSKSESKSDSGSESESEMASSTCSLYLPKVSGSNAENEIRYQKLKNEISCDLLLLDLPNEKSSQQKDLFAPLNTNLNDNNPESPLLKPESIPLPDSLNINNNDHHGDDIDNFKILRNSLVENTSSHQEISSLTEQSTSTPTSTSTSTSTFTRSLIVEIFKYLFSIFLNNPVLALSFTANGEPVIITNENTNNKPQSQSQSQSQSQTLVNYSNVQSFVDFLISSLSSSLKSSLKLHGFTPDLYFDSSNFINSQKDSFVNSLDQLNPKSYNPENKPHNYALHSSPTELRDDTSFPQNQNHYSPNQNQNQNLIPINFTSLDSISTSQSLPPLPSVLNPASNNDTLLLSPETTVKSDIDTSLDTQLDDLVNLLNSKIDSYLSSPPFPLNLLELLLALQKVLSIFSINSLPSSHFLPSQNPQSFETPNTFSHDNHHIALLPEITLSETATSPIYPASSKSGPDFSRPALSAHNYLLYDQQVLIDRLAVDERGLKKCMSRYITCINKFNETKNTEPNEKDFDSLNNEIKTVSADLLALSQSFTKNRVTSDQRNSEIQYYQNLTDNYDREIESITAEIMQLQKDLEIEKKETAKQREYDSIASNINSYDSRDMSHREIKELKEQIEKLEAEEKIHGRAMDHLRSLFSTKISTQLHHFKDLLEKAQVQDYSAFGLELELKSNSETLPIESAKVISGDEKKEEKLEIGNGVHDTSASETITQPDHKLTTSASALVHPQTPSLIHEQDTNVRNDGEMDVDSAHPQMNESATHMDVEKMDAADESTSFAVNDEEVYNCSDGEIIDE